MIPSLLLSVALAITSTSTAEPLTDTVFETRCHDAVDALHQWFEDWFNAAIPERPESLAPFRDVLADDFQYVGAAGFLIDKATIFADGTWPAHGWWREFEDGGRTRVENFSFRRVSADVALVTYEYWQDYGTIRRGRQDTAVFRRDESQPHGVLWLHVQETWLPETDPASAAD
ncbi:MAG: hypothetical protein AAGE94_10270 [Acidobacteriota bacterium]